MILLTRRKALELLDRAVAEKGRDHLAFCTYMSHDTGAPVCIVGYVVHYLDETDALLHILDEQHHGANVNHVDWESLGVDLELGVVELLYAAQKTQDSGSRWVAALAAAHDKFAEQEARTANLKNLQELNH